MKLAIIANPASGRGRAYRIVKNHFQRCHPAGWETELFTTSGPGHAGLLARELLNTPPDLLAVCGGDGTLNEVASAVPAPPFPVAILPGGTANVVARELDIPLDPITALGVALGGKIRRVDLGSLGPEGRNFVFVAGIGFDAYVAAGVRPALKARIGTAAYAAAIVECLRRYSFPEFDVSVQGRTFRATSCLVCNARSYGGGLLFCPHASMTDGFVDTLVIEGERRLALAAFLLRAWLGIAQSGPWIQRLRSDSVRIEGGVEVPTQVDGEPAGRLPIEITVLPRTFPLALRAK